MSSVDATHQQRSDGGGKAPLGRSDTLASTTSGTSQPGSRSRNPLQDLIDTEHEYIDSLTLAIRRVASAYSAQNLPPPAVDRMFRYVEAIYRKNKQLQEKLVEIGPNPSSPKALGDLLMRWVQDLEPPYRAYCEGYLNGFDDYPPFAENKAVDKILNEISLQKRRRITIDYLFQKPFGRLRYYQKLYSRLFESTEPGRSDHDLLKDANDRLNDLIDVYEARKNIMVNDEFSKAPPSPIPAPATEMQRLAINTNVPQNRAMMPTPSPTSGIPLTLDALENRIDTTKTLDIFTMQPKTIKLQMNPPNLPFHRELVAADNHVVSITSSATGQRTMHRAHVILLSDLVLITQRVPDNDPAKQHADFWLLYPPLTGKALIAEPYSDGSSDAMLQLHVMRKETLIFRCKDMPTRDHWISKLRSCKEFATAQSLKVQTNVKSTGGPSPSSNSALSPQPNGDIRRLSPQDPPPSSPGYKTPPRQEPAHAPHMSSSSSASRLSPSLPSMRPDSSDSIPISHSSVGSEFSSSFPTNSSPADTNGNLLGLEKTRSFSPTPSAAGRTEPNSRLQTSPAPEAQRGRPSRSPEFGAKAPSNLGVDNVNIRSISPDPRMMQQQQQQQQPRGGPAPANHVRSSSSGSAPGPSVNSNGMVKEILYRNLRVEPFFWKQNTWHRLASEFCAVEVRINGNGQPSVHVSIANRGQEVLNAWITPTTTIRRDNATDISVACPSGPRKEYYLFHLPHAQDADIMQESLDRAKQRASQVMPLNYPLPPMPPQPMQPNPSARNPSVNSARSKMSQSTYQSRRTTSLAATSPLWSKEEEEDDEKEKPLGPQTSTLVSQQKCKVFLQQDYSVWKNLGWGRLKLYLQSPSQQKKLVVDGDKSTLISTIVLEDGVERVGKTGVAITLSQEGARLGYVYMLQLKNDKLASAFFKQLLEGTERGQRMNL